MVNSRRVCRVASFLMLVALLAYYPNISDDYDVWWHLKYGEYFIQHHTWRIDHAQFSWTPADATWPYITWIGSSILYLTYQLGGFCALGILQWLIFGAAAWLYLRFVRLTGETVSASQLAALFLAGVAVNPILAYIKPELFTLLFFTAIVYLYFAWKITGQRTYWIYPPLFLVWVNTHGGFIIGLIFISLALAEETLSWCFRSPLRMPGRSLAFFALAVSISYVMTLINPDGIHYGRQIIESISSGANQVNFIAAYEPLWGFLFPHDFAFRKINTTWAVVLMAVSLIGLIMFLARRRVLLDWSLLLINAVFFLFGMSLFRASIYFCVLWLFSWQYLLAGSKHPENRQFQSVRGTECKSGPAALPLSVQLSPWATVFSAVVAGIILYETLTINIYTSWFGTRIADFTPVKESEFILNGRLPGPIFNDYLIGGYLVWSLNPRYKVLIDPRYGPYVKTGVWDDYLTLKFKRTKAAWTRFQRKYPVKTAVVHVTNNHDLIDMFLDDPEWGFVYFDKVAAVFVKRSAWPDGMADEFKPDMRAERYAATTNPEILFNMFYLYCNYDLTGARRIYELYQGNVSPRYRCRPYHLERMRAILESIRIKPGA